MRSEATVYRMYGETGDLLYVGMSINAPKRLAAHRLNQEWWTEVVRVDVKHFAGRHAAAAEERLAIERESPRYNRAPGTCVGWDTAAEREDQVDAVWAALDARVAAREAAA